MSSDEVSNAWRRRQALENRERARVPTRLWPLLDNATETPAREAVREFMAEPHTFLVLAGGVGNGKSVAAASALDTSPGLFRPAVELAEAGMFDREFWEQTRNAPLLVVDDLGTEPRDEKGWAAAKFQALVSHRYDWQLKTILTVNMPMAQFKAAYCDARILDRLREAGRFVAIAGESMRKPNK